MGSCPRLAVSQAKHPKGRTVDTDGRTARKLCVAVDATSYSMRNDVDQREVQRAIVATCSAAARAAGLRRESWSLQTNGDGELAVLPLGEREDAVVDRYVRELVAELDRYNSRLREESRLRLRMSIHFGRLSQADLGHAGPAPVVVMRLLDSPVLRDAMVQVPSSNLGLLVSTPVFEDTIASSATTLRPEDFRRVRVVQKEFAEYAWLWMPGREVRNLRLGSPTDQPDKTDGSARPGSPAASHVVHNEFADQVYAAGGVFGMRFGGEQ
jgi:hypothetical protein